MKYHVENNLDSFEFHDADFLFVSFDGVNLTISAKHLNIHKCTEQNPYEHDMEIECAQITFQGFCSPSYEPGRTWKMGEDGESYPVGPRVVFSGLEAMDRILEELQNGITVFHFEKEDNRGNSIGGCGIAPYFTIEFDFDSVVVTWDKYKKKAWYELHRVYRYDSVLHTPNGDETVQLIVNCSEEAVHVNGVLKQPPTVDICCKYDGKYYLGHGNDYLWIDAFADLQKHLPKEVELKCCLTCRYGNLCPVGNNINEVFCTKDVAISQKSDLFFYTEDETEREKRARKYCYVCEEYLPQSTEFYTYNDYLYFLNEG